MALDEQVKAGCEKIKNDPDFNNGPITIVGTSQGGLIARSVVETCDLDVQNLFTFGGPHMGVSDFPTLSEWYWYPISWLSGYLSQFDLT
jgi:palmitoyl-protein thioesterase